MKFIKSFTIMGILTISGSGIVQAQVSPPTVQSTRTYTQAEVLALAGNLNTIREVLICSFIDSSGITNIKRTYALTPDGVVRQRIETYAKTQSSADLAPNVNKTIGRLPASGGFDVMPRVQFNINDGSLSALTTTASGAARIFSYVSDSKTKQVYATASGFFQRNGTAGSFGKGC